MFFVIGFVEPNIFNCVPGKHKILDLFPLFLVTRTILAKKMIYNYD